MIKNTKAIFTPFIVVLCLLNSLTTSAQVSQSLDSTITISEVKKEDTFFFKDMSPQDLNIKGEIDASKHYRKYKGAATGTLITSLVSPLLGLIPAIACSSTTPKLENLGYPDQQLFQKSDYYKGYTKKAKRIKSGKVWKNWGIGLGVNIALVLIATAGAQ